MAASKRILVGVLDWGLGHATRSVPLINVLVENGCDVTIASSGNALALLQKEFPALRTVKLPGYNVRYGLGGALLPVLVQLPRMMRVVAAENALLEDLLKQESFDGIISDNRYGVFSKNVPSVIVTHQLRLVMPSLAKLAAPLANTMLKRYIHRFDECWIPDVDVTPNLSGKLSHRVKLKVPTRFIGPLSRLTKSETTSPVFDLLAVLSGPEPQRSWLEQKIMEQVANTRLKVCMVQGLVGKSKTKVLKDNLEIHTYANALELPGLFSRSRFVVMRSGYSSLMDLQRLGGKALLVPTPGQPEQEYLAKHFAHNRWSMATAQDHLDIFASLQELERLGGNPGLFDFETHKSVVKDWLQRI